MNGLSSRVSEGYCRVFSWKNDESRMQSRREKEAISAALATSLLGPVTCLWLT